VYSKASLLTKRLYSFFIELLAGLSGVSLYAHIIIHPFLLLSHPVFAAHQQFPQLKWE
jgi:hypothetical protein